MLTDYLSLLSDPDDAPQFTEVYARYRDTVRAAVLRNLNKRCDVDDAISSTWTAEARHFQNTKKFLLEPESVYKTWIVGFSALVVREENAKLPGNQNEPKERKLTGFESLVFEAIGRNAAQE